MRQFNLVTVFLVLVAASIGYLGWKFIPVYWQANEVDNLLSEVKWEASKINMFEGDERADAMIERVKQGAHDLKIDERYLDVYFAEDFSSIHADYRVEVRHFFGKTTSLEFHRKLTIPDMKSQ